jgi:hypothetical protein
MLSILFFAFSFVLLSAMEKEEGTAQLTFITAHYGENLDEYRDILLREYVKFVKGEDVEIFKDFLKDFVFPKIQKLIGDRWRIVKILSENDPIGFFSFKRLDNEGKRIGLCFSPVPEEYRVDICLQLKECAKKEFPNAIVLYTTCPTSMPVLKDRIEACGFKEHQNEGFFPELNPSKDIPAYFLQLE